MKEYLFYKFHKIYKKYGFFGIILLIISIVSIFTGIYMSIIFVSKISTSVSIIKEGEKIDQQLTGIIGDFIGGVIGTIWSFAGVILFFLALRLQSKELSLQLEEMKSTRNVFQIQQFENTFFNLLKTHNEIRQNIELRDEVYNPQTFKYENKLYNGSAAFERIKDYILEEKNELDENIEKINYSSSNTLKERKDNIKIFFDIYTITSKDLINDPKLKAKTIFKLAYTKYNNSLGHYFRNLYHILLYIKENEELELDQNFQDVLKGSKIDFYINNENLEEQKIKNKYKKYSQFLQAQMSGTELFLLFYNALFFEKLKKLVQYYDLIENLNIEDLIYPDNDIEFYKEYKDGMETIPKSELKGRNEMLKI